MPDREARNHVALMDTSVLLAALIQPERLPETVQTLLQDCGNRIYFSAVSLWEIAIKRSLNRSDFDFRSEDIEQLARETGFSELPLHSAHCHAVGDMPWHHRDPFDRLLVAQACAGRQSDGRSNQACEPRWTEMPTGRRQKRRRARRFIASRVPSQGYRATS